MTDILLLLGILYLLSCSALYFLQDKLIFFPPLPIDDVYQSVSHNEITFIVDNELLHGWKVDGDSARKKTILYFGGNAEDVVYLNFEAKEFDVRQFIAFNHPGYGKSTGKPAQQSLFNNALEIYDMVLREYAVKAEDIIVVGRSLGSSVATYLAANRKVSGLVLITPFDSIKNIASNRYRFFPVNYLLKHPFPTIDYINQVKASVLMLAAVNDEIIAEEHLQNLELGASYNNRTIRYADVGHNTIQTHHGYYLEINEFISSLEEAIQ